MCIRDRHHAVQGVQHLVPPPTGQVVFTAGVVRDIAKVQRCPKDDRVPGLQLGCQFGFLGTGQIISAAAAAPVSYIHLDVYKRQELQHVSAGYGAQDVVRDVSFAAPNGQLTALIGPNGSGKTTLLRACLLYTSRCV